jgi:uncharacterized protein
LAFVDQFGITLTLEPANQPKYLDIVQHLVTDAKLSLSGEDLEYRALQWAIRHNGLFGRTAQQFIDYLSGE